MIADALEHFEERSAIAEWDGGLSRAEAEALALQEVAARWGEAVALRVAPETINKEES